MSDERPPRILRVYTREGIEFRIGLPAGGWLKYEDGQLDLFATQSGGHIGSLSGVARWIVEGELNLERIVNQPPRVK